MPVYDKKSKDRIKAIFKEISKRTNWDMKKPMLYGYIFMHKERGLLEKTKDKLVSKGYNFIEIFLADKKEPNIPDLWVLRVEKQEVHDPDSLNNRNIELQEFAMDSGLDVYDGWDVGPIKTA